MFYKETKQPVMVQGGNGKTCTVEEFNAKSTGEKVSFIHGEVILKDFLTAKLKNVTCHTSLVWNTLRYYNSHQCPDAAYRWLRGCSYSLGEAHAAADALREWEMR